MKLNKNAGIIALVDGIIIDAAVAGMALVRLQRTKRRLSLYRGNKSGLKIAGYIPPAFGVSILSRLKIITGLDIRERHLVQQGSHNYNITRNGVRSFMAITVIIVPSLFLHEDVIITISDRA